MDELDELARAQRQTASARPVSQGGGLDWRRWVIVGCAIVSCAAIAAAYFLTRDNSPVPATDATTAAANPGSDAASRPAPAAAASQLTPGPKPATRPTRGPSRPALVDVSDPLKAIDIYHLRHGQGDTLEIKARNISRQSVFVRSVELFADGGDTKPLDNIGFWLPAGEVVVASREVPELSRRLGPDGKITAVIREAEFRDAPPEDGEQRTR